MSVKWRVFLNADQTAGLGIKVSQDGKLWTPIIVALSNCYDYMRLDWVTTPQSNQMRIDGTHVILWANHRKYTLPLSLEDQTATVDDIVFTERQELRAVPNYGKRGTWYKITPR